ESGRPHVLRHLRPETDRSDRLPECESQRSGIFLQDHVGLDRFRSVHDRGRKPLRLSSIAHSVVCDMAGLAIPCGTTPTPRHLRSGPAPVVREPRIPSHHPNRLLLPREPQNEAALTRTALFDRSTDRTGSTSPNAPTVTAALTYGR